MATTDDDSTDGNTTFFTPRGKKIIPKKRVSQKAVILSSESDSDSDAQQIETTFSNMSISAARKSDDNVSILNSTRNSSKNSSNNSSKNRSNDVVEMDGSYRADVSSVTNSTRNSSYEPNENRSNRSDAAQAGDSKSDSELDPQQSRQLESGDLTNDSEDGAKEKLVDSDSDIGIRQTRKKMFILTSDDDEIDNDEQSHSGRHSTSASSNDVSNVSKHTSKDMSHNASANASGVNYSNVSNSEMENPNNNNIGDSDADDETEAERLKLMEQRKQRRLSRRSQRFTALPSESEDDDEVIDSSLVDVKNISESNYFEIPETDDEMLEESRIQCYSPNTLMSISGRRPAGYESDSDDDDVKPVEVDAITDANKSIVEVFDQIASDAASINPNKRTRRSILNSSLALNQSLNISLIRTPEPKRYSISNDSNDVVEIKEESLNTKEDEAAISHIIDSSASESNSVIAIDDSDDDATTDLTWTPEKKKPILVQPKLQLPKMPSAKKDSQHVSQEFYDEAVEKIGKLQEDLRTCKEIYPAMKSSLPDKGENLLRRIESLQREIALKQQKLNGYIITEEMPNVKMKVAAAMPSWAEIEAGTSNIVPKHTGEQGLSTFMEQRSDAMDRLQSLHLAMDTCPAEDTLAATPYSLKIELMRHQRHGLQWMMWREKQKPRGGILADDMGLGKTLSVIALILATNELQGEDDEGEDDNDEDEDEENDEDTKKYAKMGFTARGRTDYYYGGTLVVCPASLIEQWQAEGEKRVKRNSMSIKLHHGNLRETNARRLSKYDLVITTYGLVSSEAKTLGPLHQIKWERIVLDEAHIIRNHTTAAAIACCRLIGINRWALTGTPVQNKEMDLYSLVKFLKCTPFSNLQVFKKWLNLQTQGGRDRLSNLLKPLLLRRTKAELQDKGELNTLTDKKVEVVDFDSTKAESNVYSKILLLSKTLFGQFLSQRAERDHTNNMAFGNMPPYARRTEPNAAYHKMHDKFSRKHAFTGEVKSHQILVLITRLRQVCNHPGLIDSMLEDDNNNVENDSEDESSPEMDLLAELNKLNVNDENEHDDSPVASSKASSKIMSRSNPVFDLKKRSSKCIQVLKLINKIQAETNDKIVVVSQWTSVLDILSNFLREDRIRYTELTGKTPIKLRNGIVESFNSPNGRDKIMLLSLVAGGVGLNLVGANHLILVDPHWNPQLEAQAQDRVYRVGQTKSVRIYKLICKDTIENRIKQLQEFKLELSQQVLTGSARNVSKLNVDDMKRLFDM